MTPFFSKPSQQLLPPPPLRPQRRPASTRSPAATSMAPTSPARTLLASFCPTPSSSGGEFLLLFSFPPFLLGFLPSPTTPNSFFLSSFSTKISQRPPGYQPCSDAPRLLRGLGRRHSQDGLPRRLESGQRDAEVLEGKMSSRFIFPPFSLSALFLSRARSVPKNDEKKTHENITHTKTLFR